MAGVKAVHKSGTEYTLSASSDVVVTTGGFGVNMEMCEEHNTLWPTLDESTPTMNSPAIAGDDIRMVLDAGANAVGMDKIQLYLVNNPAIGNYYYIDHTRLNSAALLVNREGHRFVNEKRTRDVILDATSKQMDSMAYEIIDADVAAEQKLYEEYQAEIDQCLKRGVLAIRTLDEVCAHLDAPAEKAKKSIEHYNNPMESDENTDFSRTDNSSKIGDGPYFMFSGIVLVHHTMGGSGVDELVRAIDKNKDVIPRLYAVGEVTSGIHGRNRFGSVAVPGTAVFGRIAAESCVK